MMNNVSHIASYVFPKEKQTKHFAGVRAKARSDHYAIVCLIRYFYFTRHNENYVCDKFINNAKHAIVV